MKSRFLTAAAVAAFACWAQNAAIAQVYNPSIVHYQNHAWTDGTYRYVSGEHVVVTGTVIHVNDDTGRLAVRSDSLRRYNVDTYNAEVITPEPSTSNIADDLSAGTRVRVVGYRRGVGLIDADRVVVLRQDPEPEPVAVVVHPDIVAPVDANPAPPVHTDPPASRSSDMLRLEGVIKSISPSDGVVCIVGDDDNQPYDIKASDADILLPRVDRAGTLADLAVGMRVRIVGERADGQSVIADRIRVLHDDIDVVPAPAPPPVLDLSVYTGIVIDVRGFSKIQRSPAPAIYSPDMTLLYPDRSHVPTPDEVQDESVVRYYRTLDSAMAGVGGTHPLVLQAISLVGPAEDGVMLSNEDAALFKALDQRLQYSHTWKVGFLTPEDR